MDFSILLLVKDSVARIHYEDALQPYQIQYDIVASLGELLAQLKKKHYNGILLDALAKARTGSSQEKQQLHRVLEMYPHALLRWNPAQRQVNYLLSVPYDGPDGLSFFINEQCRNFVSRILRTDVRRELHFNLLLADNKLELSCNPEHSVSVDFSVRGCYAYSTRNWQDIKEAWLIINEFKDTTPIQCDIRWWIPWGQKMKFPGLGLLFESITQNQQQELEDWLG